MTNITERLFNKISQTLDLIKNYVLDTWKGLDINYSEAFILYIITECEHANIPIHKSQIAKRMNITKAAITQFCNKLEKKGYITSYVSVDNKKNHYLAIDEKLKESIEARCDLMNNNLQKFVGKVGEENIVLFLDLINEFNKSLV